MANSLEHLHIGVWSYLDGSVDERVSRLYAPKWVAYSRGNQALARMEHLLNHPPSGRMPCMLLHGDSNIGKTMIVEKFVRDHPNICNEFNEVEVRKTVHLQMPANPCDDKLYAQIIEGLGVQPPINRRSTDMELLGLRLLHRQPPKLMIIDEVHHLLAGSVREQRQLLNQLKFISNELRMPIVALGTSEALYAMQTDPQIASRFETLCIAKVARKRGVSGVRGELWSTAAPSKAFPIGRKGDHSKADGPEQWVDRQSHNLADAGRRVGDSRWG